MKLRLLVLTIFALLLTLIVPVAADAAGGDTWYQQKCPAEFEGPDRHGNCTRITYEEFDAEKIVHYYCEAPYQGPNKDNQCVKHTVDTFPADKDYEYTCPDGFDGPVGKTCTKKVTTIDTVHVNEESSQVCPDGWSLDNGTCSLTIPEITTTTSSSVDEYSCPSDYAGPNAANECTKTSIATDVVAATVTTSEVCPDGFTLQSANCVNTVDATDFTGATRQVDVQCPAGLSFEAAGCVTIVPAKTIVSCETGFTLNNENGTVFPGKCQRNSDETAIIFGLDCPAPLQNLQPIAGMAGMGTCESVTPPFEVVTFSCPTGYVASGASTTLCERDSQENIVAPPIVVEVASCPDADYAGPDANGDCTKTTVGEDVIDATVTAVAVCAAGETGPDANGDCLVVGTTTITTPAIDLPSFTCPAGYDGPDDHWNCSKEVTEIKEVEAEKQVRGYTCPDDARGPNKDNVCSRDTVETVDASEEVSYICPADTHGAKDGKCVRKNVEVVPAYGRNCSVKFFDYPHAQKFLFSVHDDGQANLAGDLAHYNDDIESVMVSSGCTVSVGEHFNNSSGWCMTFGPGIHNLPDDEMSWFALPGTGCAKH